MPVLDSKTLDILSHSSEQTQRLGGRIGELLQVGDVICLNGELGTGKTTLVQGIARGWGALRHATSPSFVLLNEYRRPDGRALFHVDGYRLEKEEFTGFDFPELVAEGAVVIEWPERLASRIPPEHLWIELRWVEDTRRGLRFTPRGERYLQLVSQFRNLAFGG